MGPGSALPGGGQTALEQFVSYDSADKESIKACIKHMEDAVVDAAKMGIPPGKEYMYLQVGWPEEKVFDAWASMPQQFIFDFQRKIKAEFDPNGLGDRNYQYVPEGWAEKVKSQVAK